MSTPNDIPSKIEDQLALYFDNQATPEVCQALQNWLEEDPANAEIFAEYGYIDRMIFCTQKKEDASAVFGMLAEMEDAVEADTVTIVNLDTQYEPGTISNAFSTLSYEFKQLVPTNPKPIFFSAAGAIAAVLLLALILFSPLASDTPGPIADQDFWEDADTPQPDIPSPLPHAVATLTASHNARWDTSTGTIVLDTGDVLHAGDRLTLTAGFAEITTHRGAVAILEAPSTIEFIDSPNALNLHTGKLVGICETDTSKGFLVRMPYMDVTDLGTQFGVAVDEKGQALAKVFEGRVEVQTTATGSRHLSPRSLSSKESIALDSTGREVSRETFANLPFDRLRAFRSGIVAMSDDIRWLPMPSVSIELADWHTGKGTIVTEELRDYRLQSDLSMTLSGPGTYLQFDESADSSRVPRNTVIRSYIVTVNPGPDLIQTTTRGSITFEGEILGVITAHEHWNAFESLIPAEVGSLLTTSADRGLLESLKPDETADEIVLAEDGRTLNFKFVTEGFADAVRVIVREPEAELPPDQLGD